MSSHQPGDLFTKVRPHEASPGLLVLKAREGGSDTRRTPYIVKKCGRNQLGTCASGFGQRRAL